MKNYIFKNNKSGFTLIETLVSVAIFSSSILVMMVILGRGISDTGFVKKKVIAEYLAQEGIEYIRNMRDTFVMYDSVSPQNGWVQFYTKLLNASCSTAACYFNDNINYGSPPAKAMTTLTLAPCTDASGKPAGKCSGAPLYYHASSGKYDHNPAGGVDSGFTRKILVAYTSDDEVRFSSIVYWSQASGFYTNNITLVENVIGWAQ